MLGIVGQLRDLNAGLNAFNANVIKLGTIQVEANRIMLELGVKFGELALSVDDALRGLAAPARRRRRR